VCPIAVVFAGSRRFAEEGAYRFMGAAVADRVEPANRAHQWIFSTGSTVPFDGIFEPHTAFAI